MIIIIIINYHYWLLLLIIIIIIIIIIIGKWQRGAVHSSWAGEQTPELGVLVKSGLVLVIIISFIIIKYPVCTIFNKELEIFMI